MAVAVRGQP